MNGAVFHTSAMTIAQNEDQWPAVQMMSVPKTWLTTPSGWKFHSQSLAATAVGIAHGTSTLARTRPRPRKALFMINAMAKPMTSSNAIVTMVSWVVNQNAGQKTSAPVPVRKRM